MALGREFQPTGREQGWGPTSEKIKRELDRKKLASMIVTAKQFIDPNIEDATGLADALESTPETREYWQELEGAEVVVIPRAPHSHRV